MSDVKFPEIAQSNNNSFIDGRGLGGTSKQLHGNNEYQDGSSTNKRNQNDIRSQSFHSSRDGNRVGNGLGKTANEAKKQRKE